MNTFALQLYDASQARRIDGVTDFIGTDASGSFGIRTHHTRFMTALTFGLARFRLQTAAWQYLALPGAILYFDGDVLTLSTRHYLLDTQIERISALLEDQLAAEEANLHSAKLSLHKMEQAMLSRLWKLKRRPT